MVKLARQVRFAVSPFGAIVEGANSYCAKPTADGLSVFFALWVELTGDVNTDTGFIINVSDIDRIVRNKTVGIFDEFVKNRFKLKEQINFEQIGQLLSRVWRTIEKDFLPAKINSLAVELMPKRTLGIKEKGGDMLYFSEKFEFSASHTLWNGKFSDDENYRIFGKCANKSGHGHNYIVEVTVKKPLKGNALKAGAFENLVEKEFIRIVDHKNLNVDVKHFKKVSPTVENIAQFAFRGLKDKLKPLRLDCVTVWENDRTFCCYRED
jgi:6-pyruvoyltetrahydropterin/6-carboxytetrahydropterin synthase